METSSIVLVVVSASISFGIGRLISQFWRKRRRQQMAKSLAEAERHRPPEPEAKNKAKRKRQLLAQSKASRKL